MILSQVLKSGTAHYPFGNTSAVSLTQDLPPEQDADILLLGCGDVRNVLFTCFADATRKMDVTCCDIEPAVQARNTLLYTLLMEDKANHNIKRIWNIYYHWKLDKGSLDLLETQAGKLMEVSETIDQWHNSVYGSSIRFCDAKSLSLVRSYWMGFRLKGLSHSEEAKRLSQLQGTIDKAKALRGQKVGGEFSATGLGAASPVGLEAIMDLCTVRSQYWDCGAVLSSDASAVKLTYLNPALLYLLDPTLWLYSGIDPLLGIPISIAFAPVTEGSVFCPENKAASAAEHLVNCAQSLFAQWASAFRRAVANKLVIRIFCGEALAFCLTLRNCQLKSMNLLINNEDPSDCGSMKNSGPLSFDVIDTSNVVDHTGPLNLITAASSLLKYQVSSTLYTEMLVQRDSGLVERLSGFFGADVRTMSLLLGLVSPDLFTNATDIFEEDPVIQGFTKFIMCGSQPPPSTQARSRLRWRRLQGYQESSIFVEAKLLASFLVRVHYAMFKHEDLTWMRNTPTGASLPLSEAIKLSRLVYNRGSFASLLNVIRATVVTDWDECVKLMYDSIFCSYSRTSFLAYKEDLLLCMHLYGVDNGSFKKPALVDITDAILAPILPFSAGEDVPEVLCVTVRVCREQLKLFTSKTPNQLSIPVLTCSFEDGDPGGKMQPNFFSTVRFTFGTLHKQTEASSSFYINEDSAQLLGTSDMFISVMVPTQMLLQYKQYVPLVKCKLVFTPQTLHDFIITKDLALDLCFARCKMTSENVWITRHMPIMSVLTVSRLALAQKDKPTLATTTVRLTQNGLKVDTLIRRVILESEAAKAELANQSSAVGIEFKTPLKAIVSIAQSYQFKLEFPVPVSPSNYRLRIARKSGYIEVETPLFDPLSENSATFLFPAFISEVPRSILLWSSTRIDLDVMPPLDLKDASAISWLIAHAFLMFSERERHIHKLNTTNPSVLGSQVDIRTDLKDGLYSILMHYTGLQGQQAEVFGLSKTDGGIQTLFFPSCLRLDLVNHTVVLDAAVIPVTKTMSSDPRAIQFLEKVTSDGLCEVKVSQAENLAWKAMMPALVERCRTAATWRHTASCEYIEVGEVPLPRALNEDGESPICSCGVGKFPHDYLKSLTQRWPDCSYIINQYATHIALAPVFAVPYVEDCALNDIPEKLGYFSGALCYVDDIITKFMDYLNGLVVLNREKCVMKEQCVKCRRKNSQAGAEGLLRCSRCKNVKYCLKECQKADWKKHKLFCLAA